MPETPDPRDLATRLLDCELSRPAICVSRRENKAILGDFREYFLTIAEHLDIFRSQNQLVTVVEDENECWMARLSFDVTRGLLERAVDTVRHDRNGELVPANVPPVVTRDLAALPDYRLRELRRIVRVPTLLASSRWVQHPGWDRESCMYLALAPELIGLSIPADPDPYDVEAARLLLLEDFLGDFPFESEADRANAVALILTGFVRELFDGPCPLFFIEADRPGTGKTLLARVVSILLTGTDAGVMVLPPDEDQIGKKVTAALGQGRQFLTFDNVSRIVDSGALAALATSSVWTDRRLQTSDMLRFDNNCQWVLTGNQIQTSREIRRRSVNVLLAPTSDATAREYQHPELERWTLKNRSLLVHSVLVLVARWLACARPSGTQRVPSYVSWSRLIGGILDAVGIEGFLQDRDRLHEHADPEELALAEFLQGWSAELGTRAVAAADLIDIARHAELSVLKMRESRHEAVCALGKFLSRLSEHRALAPPGYSLHRTVDRSRKSGLYVLQVVPEGSTRPEYGGPGEQTPATLRAVSDAITTAPGVSGVSGVSFGNPKRRNHR